MKDEQQRIAIAESVGWRNCYAYTAENTDRLVVGQKYEGTDVEFSVPDYLNDLNNWVCLERGLSQGDRETYQEVLINICQCPFEAIHATAAQRAEAYLRTIGKWVG